MTLRRIVVGEIASANVDDQLHKELNQFANMLQVAKGHISRPDFDYYAATHPEERQAYAMAVIVYSYASEVQPDWLSYDEELHLDDVDPSSNLHAQLNEIAGMFYSSKGYIERDGFDFRSSPHPGERSEYVLALVAVNTVVYLGLDWCE